MAFEITKTNKGVDCLIHDLFKFRRVQRVDPNTITWRCCHKLCPSQILTDASLTRIISKRGDHSHAALTDRQREVCLVSTACKRAATEVLDSRPRKILRKEIRNRDHILKPDVKNIYRRMYHAKRKLLPTLPKSGAEAVDQLSNDIEIETSRGEQFSFTLSEKGIILFTCETNLRLLAECETLLADGTFEFAPDKFAQLYSIHGNHKGHNIRLAYACLPDKKGPTYVAMFEFLKSLVREKVGKECRPNLFLVDFEDAALSAIRECFPEADIRACRFHFTQNCIKRIRANKRLLSLYRKADSETGKWLRAFNGLPCLPPAMVPV